MINPTHLTTLREVIASGSFSAAAQRLGYTASAVSQQIAALERDSNTVLFIRSARSIQATEAAKVMARHAERVLTDLETLLVASHKAPEQHNSQLHLGVFPSFASYVLPRVLQDPTWQGLGVALRLSIAEPGHTIQGLRTGGPLDLALVYHIGQSGLAWPQSLTRQWVADDHFRVALPRAWGISAGSQMAAEQLAEMPWILHHPGTPDATVLERLFASSNLHPEVVASSDDFTASLALCAAGVGACLIPDLVLKNTPADLPDHEVITVEVPEFRVARTIFALRPSLSANTQTSARSGQIIPARAEALTAQSNTLLQLLTQAYAAAIA